MANEPRFLQSEFESVPYFPSLSRHHLLVGRLFFLLPHLVFLMTNTLLTAHVLFHFYHATSSVLEVAKS